MKKSKYILGTVLAATTVGQSQQVLAQVVESAARPVATTHAEELAPKLEQPKAEATTPEVKVPTKAEVAEATAKEEQAAADVTRQEEAVQALDAEKTVSDKAVTEATAKVEEANVLLKETTPEKVAEADKAVDDQKASLATAETALVAATEAKQVADTTVQAATAVHTDANAVVAEKEVAVEAAASKVAAAQPVDTAALTQAAATAQTALDQAVTEEVAAEQAYNTVVAANKDKAAAVELATKAIEAAKTEVATAEQDAATAALAETAAKEVLAGASTEIEDREQREYTVRSISNIFKGAIKEAGITDGFTDIFMALANDANGVEGARLTDEERAAYQRQMDLRSEAFDYFINGLVYTEADKDEIVDPYNVTDEQLKSLNRFSILVLNAIRSAIGTPELTYQENVAVEMSRPLAKAQLKHLKELAAGMVDPEKLRLSPVRIGHLYPTDIYNTTKTLPNAGTYGTYENNIGFLHFPQGATMTMGRLKMTAMGTLKGMLFHDGHSAWGHARSMSGISDREYDEGDKRVGREPRTSRLTFVQAIVADPKHSALVWFNTGIDAKSPYYETAKLHNIDTEKAAVSDQLTRIAEAQAQAAQAQAAKTEAEGRARTAKAKLDQAKAHLASLSQGDAGLEVAAKTLADKRLATTLAREAKDDAQATLARAEEANRNAAATLAAAQADLATAQTALDEAKAARSLSAQALEVATNDQAAAGNRLAQATAAREEAKAALAAKEERADALKNAPAYLEKAEHALALAKKEAARILAELDAANQALKDLKAKHQDAAAESKKVQDLYNKHQAALKAIDAKRRALNTARLELTPTADGGLKVTTTAKGVTATPSRTLTTSLPAADLKAVAKADVKAEVKSVEKPAAKPAVKTLPETGAATSSLALLGYAGLVGLSWQSARKRKR